MIEFLVPTMMLIRKGVWIEEEDYFLTNSEIIERLKRAGFTDIKKRYLGTQWGLNHLFVGWKK